MKLLISIHLCSYPFPLSIMCFATCQFGKMLFCANELNEIKKIKIVSDVKRVAFIKINY